MGFVFECFRFGFVASFKQPVSFAWTGFYYKEDVMTVFDAMRIKNADEVKSLQNLNLGPTQFVYAFVSFFL